MMDVQVSGQGAMEVVDFGSLTLQPVVDPVDLSATASVQLHQQVCCFSAIHS